MIAPRIEIDLAKIQENARILVNRLAPVGISVTGVTKAVLGSSKVANAMLKGGVHNLCDSRMDNIESLRNGDVSSSISLIRSPMLSQVDRVVQHASISFNTELEVIRSLSVAAQKLNCIHEILLMVELGDLREGILPEDIEKILTEAVRLPNIAFRGIGTNLACRSGVTPNKHNMGILSALANSIEDHFDLKVDIVSGGNSANLLWALSGVDSGRINNLRLGESILLGREPLHSQPIEGLSIDAFTLVAEVIETKTKKSQPSGDIGETSFGMVTKANDRGLIRQSIVALGHQDTDPEGITPISTGINVLGSSSDHVILDDLEFKLVIGSEVSFNQNYSALIRSMASPFVTKIFKNDADNHNTVPT